MHARAWSAAASASACVAILAAAAPARAQAPLAQAEPRDGTAAFLAGATSAFAGFALGSTLVAVAGDDPTRTNVGWLVMEGGFVVAPLAAHAMVGEWARGALFAALPAAAMAASLAPLLEQPRGAVDHGSIEEQRVMWSFFGVSMLASAAGVVDAALPRGLFPRRSALRGLRLMPAVGASQAGLMLGGAL
jgi:hypothetical protein